MNQLKGPHNSPPSDAMLAAATTFTDGLNGERRPREEDKREVRALLVSICRRRAQAFDAIRSIGAGG